MVRECSWGNACSSRLRQLTQILSTYLDYLVWSSGIEASADLGSRRRTIGVDDSTEKSKSSWAGQRRSVVSQVRQAGKIGRAHV